MVHAADLLEAAGAGRLERFLTGLVKRAWPGPAPASAPVTQALAGGLAATIGNVLRPAPHRGTPELAKGAGHALGLELEGLSSEDREFEAARQLVHLVGAAIADAAAAPAAAAPDATARAAIAAAAASFAPGLFATLGPPPRSSGRWVRRGGRIIVEGA
jgi:hypothetical protein